jgi:hypothetical protein
LNPAAKSPELAAYFRGRRTEREAKAALKIIKALVRDRERSDPADRLAVRGQARSDDEEPADR